MSIEERAQGNIELTEAAISLAKQDGDEARVTFLTGYLEGMKKMQQICLHTALLNVGDKVSGEKVYGAGNYLTGTITEIEKSDIGPRWDTIFIKWDNERSAAFHRKDIEDKL